MLELFKTYAQSRESDELDALCEALSELRAGQGHWGRAYYPSEIETVVTRLKALESELPSVRELGVQSEDAPIQFDLSAMPDHMQALSWTGDFASAAGHSSYLIARLRTLLGDLRLMDVVSPSEGSDLAEWLCDVIGAEDS